MNAYDTLYDDEDLSNDSYRCKHGTFTGNPHGGDYLCGWCEDGSSDEDYAAYIEAMRATKAHRWVREALLGDGFAHWRTFRQVWGATDPRLEEYLTESLATLTSLTDSEAIAYLEAAR